MKQGSKEASFIHAPSMAPWCLAEASAAIGSIYINLIGTSNNLPEFYILLYCFSYFYFSLICFDGYKIQGRIARNESRLYRTQMPHKLPCPADALLA